METCIAMLNRDGLALKYVDEQTEEVCLVAVQQNGMALEYVKTQTSEVCMAAVQQNGMAFLHVQTLTVELCRAAAIQNPNVRDFIPPEFSFACNGLCHVTHVPLPSNLSTVGLVDPITLSPLVSGKTYGWDSEWNLLGALESLNKFIHDKYMGSTIESVYNVVTGGLYLIANIQWTQL